YSRNATEVWTWMDHSDDALDKATKVMQRMEYLAVQASNDSYSDDERISIMQEVNQLKEQLVGIANTNVNGKYIFNGTDTDVKCCKLKEDCSLKVNIKEETLPVQIEDSKRIKMPVNVNPEEIFNKELFEKIDQFTATLENNDSEEIQNSIEDIN